jgi:hypothetical protein
VSDVLLFDSNNNVTPLLTTNLALVDAQIAKILDAGLAVVFGMLGARLK